MGLAQRISHLWTWPNIIRLDGLAHYKLGPVGHILGLWCTWAASVLPVSRELDFDNVRWIPFGSNITCIISWFVIWSICFIFLFSYKHGLLYWCCKGSQNSIDTRLICEPNLIIFNQQKVKHDKEKRSDSLIVDHENPPYHFL